ncbi:hypothetical protein ACIQ7D_01940 [Streptomyces sp. NPDC096310]
MTPRRALRPGDLLESEVEGIGRLANPVLSAAGGAGPLRPGQVAGGR